MNFNSVVSGVAAVDLSNQEHLAVTLTSTGINIAGATDTIIGTLQRGNLAGKAVAVHLLKANGLHYAQIGNGTAIAIGDALDQAAGGKLVKHTSGTIVALAWEGLAAGNTDAQIRALFL